MSTAAFWPISAGSRRKIQRQSAAGQPKPINERRGKMKKRLWVISYLVILGVFICFSATGFAATAKYNLKLANGFGDQKMQPLPCSAR
jgi:hypothetical protein